MWKLSNFSINTCVSILGQTLRLLITTVFINNFCSCFCVLVYDLSRPFGESCYRLISRTGQFIYLRTKGYLEIDEETHRVHSFICVNTLVSEDEGRRLVREMKRKFSVIINQQVPEAIENEIQAVENPHKLEKAILNLITNLNNTRDTDDDNMSVLSNSTNDDSRSTKSPPLAIIPPKPSSIKPSIVKSVNVIVSAIKSKNAIKKEPESPTSMNSSRPSVLQKHYNSSIESDRQSSSSSPIQVTSISGNIEDSYNNYSSPSSIDNQANIKIEQNILSPTSSLSSIDSESLPSLSTPKSTAPTTPNPQYIPNTSNSSRSNIHSVSNSETDEFSTSYDSLPLYETQQQYNDPNMCASPPKVARIEEGEEVSANLSDGQNGNMPTTNKSVVNLHKNNNMSNVNRNTVLKRTHSGDLKNDLAKKRTVRSESQTSYGCGSGKIFFF